MKTLKYPILFIGLMALLFSTKAMSYDLTASVGNLCEYVGKIQTDEDGSTNICSFNPYIASSLDFEMKKSFLISPEIGITMPRSGRENGISKMSLFTLANIKYLTTSYHFIGGLGLFFTRISGNGGSADLNNGTGVTSFPMPDSAVYTRNFIINLGAGTDFNKEWGADIHTYIFNALTSIDRAFSIAINGVYHFGEF